MVWIAIRHFVFFFYHSHYFVIFKTKICLHKVFWSQWNVHCDQCSQFCAGRTPRYVKLLWMGCYLEFLTWCCPDQVPVRRTFARFLLVWTPCLDLALLLGFCKVCFNTWNGLKYVSAVEGSCIEIWCHKMWQQYSDTPWQVEELKIEIIAAVKNITEKIPVAVMENFNFLFCKWFWMHRLT
jgi:hypothetical protein